MNLLSDFQAYLQEKGYTKSTIRIYGYSVEQFIDWTIRQGIAWKEVRYQDLLAFVRYCRKQGQSYDRTRTHLMALRLFFAWAIRQKHTRHNPARQVYLKSRGRRLPHDLLDYPIVEQLYEDYPNNGLRKLMLSLMVFQALRLEELQALRVAHLNLTQGKLAVPTTHLSNARHLSLVTAQILPLYEWTKGKTPEDFLLPSPKGTQNLRASSYKLYAQLRNINPEVRNGQQLRQSVITHWLKHHDIRKVQYMAGHKWVSSTERYQQSNLEDLQNQLDKYHPLS